MILLFDSVGVFAILYLIKVGFESLNAMAAEEKQHIQMMSIQAFDDTIHLGFMQRFCMKMIAANEADV